MMLRHELISTTALLVCLWLSPLTVAQGPSDVPSLVPTFSPQPTTESPTRSPVIEPSGTPSTLPTIPQGTVPPSLTPSFTPSAEPSGHPSLSAMPSTSRPTSRTTSQPTGRTTEQPSQLPTMKPSKAPTMPSPTARSPTAAPSPSPVAPTSSPTPGGSPQTYTLTNQIKLDGVGEMGSARSQFVNVMQTFYTDTAYGSGSSTRRRRLALANQAGIRNLTTSVAVAKESVDNSGSSPVNTVTYNQTLNYIDVNGVNTWTPTQIVQMPFQDSALNQQFVNSLRSSGSTFSGLTKVGVPAAESGNKSTSASSGGLSKGAIAGIVIAGAVVLFALLRIVVLARRVDQNPYRDASHPPGQFTADQVDDISAMQDLGPGGVSEDAASSALGYGDQSVATVDYDYSKAYGGAGDTSVVSSAGGTMGENTRLTSEVPAGTAARAALGASFDSGEQGMTSPNVKEEVMVINAPAGKLGVVIDTPDDGAPVVHAVKDSSVIADQIQVGDKLVSVDDEDVTAMTAIKVSKLISKKSANPVRRLTIIRTSIVDEP